MKIRNFFVGAAAALAMLVGCQEQEQNLGTPDISIDKNEMTFEVAGGEQELTVSATRDWKVETDADWVVVSPESGAASVEPQTVTVTVLENTGMDRSADLKFTIGMKSKYLTVSQAGPGGSPEALIVYYNNYDKAKAEKTFGSSGDRYPYLDQFDGWKNATGTGVQTVEYAYNAMSTRSNSTSDSSYSDYPGSGMNNMFFGASAYFATKNITLPAATGYTLTFGTEKYDGNNKEACFDPAEVHVYLSNDGTKWVEQTYTFAGTVAGRWNIASTDFSVPSGTTNLSICIKVDAASVYRMDDLKLVISEGGDVVDFSKGVEMDFTAGGNTGGGNQGGGESDATAIYSNNYDKSAAVQGENGWPFLDSSDAWKNAAGTGAANVTYASKNVTVRNNSNSNGSYSDYDGSGLNNIFFGKDYPYFATKNIALNGATGLTLTFGTEKYSQTLGSTFTTSEYHIYLSNDGTKWVELTDYTFAGTADGKWNVATANFTVPAGTENLSICMQVDVASAYRLDDMKLVASEGGATVDFSAAVEKDFNAGATDGDGGEDEPDTPVSPSEPGEYDPQGGITWTLGTNAYDNTSGTNAQSATVNGVGVANLLKLGTSSKIGDAILHVPAGTEKIGFYCVAWKDKTAQVKFSINGEELKTIEPKSNTGATSNAPYTITVTDSDYYVIDMPSTDAVDVKVETVDPANGRALFIKLEANPSSEGGEVTPPEGGEVTPPEGGETPEPGTVGTIAEVLALGNGAKIPENTVIEGVVISNMELNNLTSKKGMYVQDETAALQFYLAANHEFAFGDKVQIDLSGVTVGAYNGAVQISGLALDKITKISSGNTVTPKTVTMADFLANKYEGQYIALEGVQVADSDLSNTFVMGGAHTSINMEDASGNKFVVFSSKYATYGATEVPQGSGTIKGISSINNGTIQIIFCQQSDFAGLTGTRFDGTEVTPPAGGDDNQGGTEEPDQPVTPPTTGNEVWKYEFKNGDFGSTYSAPVTKTFNDVEWTCTMIGSTYFGYDSNNGRGLQMGKSKEPATEITLSTSGITGNIKKVVVNTSGASNTDAKLNVKVGEVALGSQVGMTTTATDVTFEATTATAGVLELKWTLTTAAVYVKSITVYTE